MILPLGVARLRAIRVSFSRMLAESFASPIPGMRPTRLHDEKSTAGLADSHINQRLSNRNSKRGKSGGCQVLAQRCVMSWGSAGTSGWFGTARRAPR
jgi:hypothetical protein